MAGSKSGTVAKQLLSRRDARDRKDAAIGRKLHKNFKGFSYEKGERFAVFTNVGL